MIRKILISLGWTIGLAGICLITVFCGNRETGPAPNTSKLRLTSTAFQNNASIPVRFTCDGSNVSPSLQWADPPAGTRTFALITEDPDAPMGTFGHWVVYNIPPDSRGLPEGHSSAAGKTAATVVGRNDFGQSGYGGPCPPPGSAHRYFFRLYALDTTLSLGQGARRSELLKALQGHILADGNLMGTYKR
ncbi:MAG: YbhB/YbcL family Raf kinase inhibitor-like protein [Acidobacteriia bacterium]|nr:YbhB/YbcL family Raf kinase inhibitor-like protein [Terriglobia bacterium]